MEEMLVYLITAERLVSNRVKNLPDDHLLIISGKCEVWDSTDERVKTLQTFLEYILVKFVDKNGKISENDWSNVFSGEEVPYQL